MADMAVSKSKLRIDLIASMGLPVMSLLSDGKQNTVVFFQIKRFYRGEKLQNVIKQFFDSPVSIGIFKDILFEKPPHNAIWQCQRGAANRWKQCVYQNTYIKWIRKKGKLLSIKSPGRIFTFHYSTFSPKVQSNMFDLKIPDHFKPLLAH